MSNICNCKGECLKQTNYDLNKYEKDNLICNHNCQPKKCPNYILCNTKAPESVFDCSHGMCINCDITFGTWKGGKGIPEIKDNTECPICLETKICITQPKCEHFTCIDCFKRCHYGDDNYDKENEPKFPYDSDIEDEYYDDTENIKWTNDVLIIKYNKDWNEWDDKKRAYFQSQEYLQNCPLCRS
jgi:hypothetical protein